MALLGGCGLFRGSTPVPGSPDDPFADGVMKYVAAKAPPGSVSQYLATIGDQLGWESQLSQNTPLRQSILAGEYEQRVQPYLLSLFFRNGYTILPTVGEGHEITRDTLVRGGAGTTRLLVSTRQQVRIVFVGTVQNVQVIYPMEGVEPQIFAVTGTGVVAVRRSLSESFLR